MKKFLRVVGIVYISLLWFGQFISLILCAIEQTRPNIISLIIAISIPIIILAVKTIKANKAVREADYILQQRLDAKRRKRALIEADKAWLSANYNMITTYYHTFIRGTLLSFSVDEQKCVTIFNHQEIPFAEIFNAELLLRRRQTSTTVSSASKEKGVKRAVIGGLLAGGAGAIVGTVTAKEVGIGTTQTNSADEAYGVIIYLSNIRRPQIEIVGRDKFCRQVYATICAIISQKNTKLTP